VTARDNDGGHHDDDLDTASDGGLGGVHIKYLLHCPRQLWLYTRGLRPEAGSDRVVFGEAVDDTSYTRRHGVDLGAATIDWMTAGATVHEVKSSRVPSPQHDAQARHYCLLLDRLGVNVRRAVLHYPLTRRTLEIPWTASARAQAEGTEQQAAAIISRRDPPPRLARPMCRNCSTLTTAGETPDMPSAGRTYWLTEPCRIRREAASLRIERADMTPVHVPVTDILDLVAFDHVDINTSAISLLGRHGVIVHVLDYYGNYAGAIGPADGMSSASVIRKQVAITTDPVIRLKVARALVEATAANVRWALDTDLLAAPLSRLSEQLAACEGTGQVMGVEGNFRRTAWEVADTALPPWLRLSGRSRRPPANAGNAFISYANAITYARMLTALRCTPLHPALGFLHSDTDRRRNTLALDLAEPFKPLFAERLLRRAAAQKVLRPADFESTVNHASLTKDGRKKVAELIRSELATTVYHRSLHRKVSYEELLHLEALKIVRLCLENTPYKPLPPWW
jgi:CRISP-associated protein Cas1